MNFKNSEISLKNYLSFFIVGTILVVMPTLLTNSINLPKLFLLLGLSIFITIYVLTRIHFRMLFYKKVTTLIFALLTVGTIFSFIFSEIPINEKLYGTDRRIGLVTLLSLFLIYYGFNFINSSIINKNLISVLCIANFLVLSYGFFQFLDLDFIPWPDNLSPGFSTLGNINFASAFIASNWLPTLIFCFTKIRSVILRTCVVIIFSFFTLYYLILNSSLQGIFIFAIQLILVSGKFFLNNNRKRINYLKFFCVLISMFITLFFWVSRSILQSDTSIVARFDYLRGGLAIIKRNWLTGVGPDAFRYFYPQARSQPAGSRGWNETADSAHNYFVDIFAMLGLLPALGFVLLTIISFLACMKILVNSSFIEPFFSWSIVWLSLFAHTLISPISIPLALIFFIASGILSSYGFGVDIKWSKINKDKDALLIRPINMFKIFFISILCSSIILFRPINKDFNVQSALNQGSSRLLYESLLSSPVNSSDFRKIIPIFRKSNQFKVELELLKVATRYNTKDLDSWKQIIANPLASSRDIDEAYQKWIELDPHDSRRKSKEYYFKASSYIKNNP